MSIAPMMSVHHDHGLASHIRNSAAIQPKSRLSRIAELVGNCNRLQNLSRRLPRVAFVSWTQNCAMLTNWLASPLDAFFKKGGRATDCNPTLRVDLRAVLSDRGLRQCLGYRNIRFILAEFKDGFVNLSRLIRPISARSNQMAQPNCRSLVHMMLCDDSGIIKAFRAIRARSSTDTSDRRRPRVSWTSLTHDKKPNEKKKRSAPK